MPTFAEAACRPNEAKSRPRSLIWLSDVRTLAVQALAIRRFGRAACPRSSVASCHSLWEPGGRMKTPSNVSLKRARVDNATLERRQATLPDLQITVRPLWFPHSLFSQNGLRAAGSTKIDPVALVPYSPRDEAVSTGCSSCR